MEVVKLNYAERVHLYPIGDGHVGDNNCDLKSLQATVDAINNDPYGIALLMGDMLNCATKTSPGKAVFDQCMDTTAQMKLLKKIISPIANKTVGALPGNHEERLSKEGVSVTELLCDMLGIRYLGYSTTLIITIGDRRYVVFATHGAGGGGARPGIVTKLLRLTALMPADIYLRGHSHGMMWFTEPKNKVIDDNVLKNNTYFVDTGAFLVYDGSYAEQGNMNQANIGSWKIIMDADKIEIKKVEI